MHQVALFLYFAKLPTKKVPILTQSKPRTLYNEPILFHREIYGYSNRIHMAWHTPSLYSDEDSVADVAATVLTGLFNSRFRRGSRYTIDHNAYQQSLHAGSVFHLVANLGKGVSLEDARKEMETTVAGLWSEPPTDFEIDAAVQRLMRSLLLRLEDALEKARFFTDVLTALDRPVDPIDYEHRRYRAVTGQAVRDFVIRYLRPENRAIVVFDTGRA